VLPAQAAKVNRSPLGQALGVWLSPHLRLLSQPGMLELISLSQSLLTLRSLLPPQVPRPPKVLKPHVTAFDGTALPTALPTCPSLSVTRSFRSG
jgi:hypothetical protein